VLAGLVVLRARVAALVIALLFTTDARADVTIVRDDADRIATAEIATGAPDRKHITYRIEAAAGGDVRDAPALLVREVPLSAGAVARLMGGPLRSATAQARDPDTGALLASEPGPDDELLTSLGTTSTAAIFLLIQCSSIGFGGTEEEAGRIANRCKAYWLAGGSPHHAPLLDPTSSPAFRTVPAPRSPLDEALLGCGALFGTSCDADGVDLRRADPSVLHQRFPGLEAPLPPGGDSDVLEVAAWNFFTMQALASGMEPGTGEAAACTFEMPEGCAALGIRPQRFAARRPLPDEPVAGPALRWDWELGTTFSLESVAFEGDVSPVLRSLVEESLPLRVHLVRALRRTGRRDRRGRVRAARTLGRGGVARRVGRARRAATETAMPRVRASPLRTIAAMLRRLLTLESIGGPPAP
jgi:hypothetical protein